MLGNKTRELIRKYIIDIQNKNQDREFEIRLGNIVNEGTKKSFDPNLSKNYFFSIVNHLNRDKDFNKREEYIIFEQKKGSERIRFNENKEVFEYVKKRRKKDIQIIVDDSDLDLRISISKEIKINKNAIFNKKKVTRKKRITYMFQFTAIDLTITNIGKNNMYQIEVESLNKKLSGSEINDAVDEMVSILERMLSDTQ